MESRTHLFFDCKIIGEIIDYICEKYVIQNNLFTAHLDNDSTRENLNEREIVMVSIAREVIWIVRNRVLWDIAIYNKNDIKREIDQSISFNKMIHICRFGNSPI